MNYKNLVRAAKVFFKEKYEPSLRKNFEGDVRRKEEQIAQWKFWYITHFTEGAEWASEQFEKELKIIEKNVKKDISVRFMKYLDNNKKEGKMCLSNIECEDIEKAFQLNDFGKLFRYYDKYVINQKQQWIDEACERVEEYFAPDGSFVPENIRLFQDLKRVIKGE